MLIHDHNVIINYYEFLTMASNALNSYSRGLFWVMHQSAHARFANEPRSARIFSSSFNSLTPVLRAEGFSNKYNIRLS